MPVCNAIFIYPGTLTELLIVLVNLRHQNPLVIVKNFVNNN